jgi:hypothetical protein
VRSTLSKPATKIFLYLQVLIHEFKEFVNYAGDLIISRKLLYFTPDGSGSSAPRSARPPRLKPCDAGRARDGGQALTRSGARKIMALN